MKHKLLQKIDNHSAIVAVVGLGYVGLPLALEFAESGFRVLGMDTNEARVATLNHGRSPIRDIDGPKVAHCVETGTFVASLDYSLTADADAVIICVPTPLTDHREPDLSYIKGAVDGIAPHVKKGVLVSLESTTYPGTTEELIVRRFISEGKRLDEDVFVAFSPERVNPGDTLYNTRNTPKVVGGASPASTELAVALYSSCIERVIPVSSTAVAEMTKLLENTFRSVNIAFVNEMALLCERLGVSIWEVIEAASTKPFGFMPFFPGPGIGGHCIPLDPAYLSWKAKEKHFYSRFIELSQEINESMPQHVVNKIGEALNWFGKSIRGSCILLVGMAYKPDVDDLRESPSLQVFSLLRDMGAELITSDPFVDHFYDRSSGLVECRRLTPELLRSADCTVILTAHSNINYSEVVSSSQLVVDTRNAVRATDARVFRLGESVKSSDRREYGRSMKAAMSK